MKRMMVGFTSVFLVAALSCADIWAQATAQISGTVRDQSGAVFRTAMPTRFLQFALKYVF